MRTVIHTKHQYRTLFTCLLTHPQVKQEVVQIRLVHNSVFHQSAVSWLNSQNCIPSRSISSLHSDIKIANSSLKYFTTSDGIASPLLHTVSLKLALIPYYDISYVHVEVYVGAYYIGSKNKGTSSNSNVH